MSGWRIARSPVASVLATFALLASVAVPGRADVGIASVLEDGQRVRYFVAGRVAARETTLTGYGMAGLKLREVTNGGRRLVQAVFKGNKLLECEIIKGGGKRLWKDVKETMGKHFNNTSGMNAFSIELGWLDMAALSRDCRRKKKQLSKNKEKHHPGTDPDRFSTTVLKSAATSNSLYKTKPRRHSRYRTKLKTVQLDHMAKGHKHLAKHDIITPGTKWCGPSNRAMKYTDLGGFWEPDNCCREHDMCALSILPMEHKYSYANIGPFTLSHCSCDRRFRACLKMTRAGSSVFVGKMFFNVIQRQCFILQPETVCVQRSWTGKCLKSEIQNTAVLKDNEPY
ncbi:Phospholipase A2 [Nesidiocoris tenuis]|uniref:phospholipase A2 n=1 Tax=Nesidiocoris tenuis TaxID=355587 RepID=A0ABN7AZ79_9HEMI|nr:Phospholipase A2 [Nesidiocoris tenuis]